MLLPDGRGQTLPYEYTQADFASDVLERVPEVENHFLVPYESVPGVHNLFEDLARLRPPNKTSR